MTQPGTKSTDPVINWLRKNGIPVTRENWIDIAYMGDPPSDEEIDDEIPEELKSDG